MSANWTSNVHPQGEGRLTDALASALMQTCFSASENNATTPPILQSHAEEVGQIEWAIAWPTMRQSTTPQIAKTQ